MCRSSLKENVALLSTTVRAEREGRLRCPICRCLIDSDALVAVHSEYHTQAEEAYVLGANHLVRCPLLTLHDFLRNYKICDDDVVHERSTHMDASAVWFVDCCYDACDT